VEHLSKPESKFLYNTHKRLLGLLSVCSEELPGVPLFYLHSALCNVVKLETPALLVFRSAVLSAGYQVSGSHCVANAIKTTAPNDVMWDIMRCWHKIRPAKMKNLSENSPGYRILAIEPKIPVDFTKRKEAVLLSSKLPRYIHTPGGGPKVRAKGKRKERTPNSDEPPSQKRKLNTKKSHPLQPPIQSPSKTDIEVAESKETEEKKGEPQ